LVIFYYQPKPREKRNKSKGNRFNRQSEAEANKQSRSQPAATRRRAKLWAAVGFLAAEGNE